ncbi:hypothetical protein R3P38DRAFT_3192854 [Favolaschia claudopus]|uniref:Uncharacterized protein n=1 Tax=Favolaschia claudopus TaxID=2862362 RepID=A0AAW0BIN5_9AGAR
MHGPTGAGAAALSGCAEPTLSPSLAGFGAYIVPSLLMRRVWNIRVDDASHFPIGATTTATKRLCEPRIVGLGGTWIFADGPRFEGGAAVAATSRVQVLEGRITSRHKASIPSFESEALSRLTDVDIFFDCQRANHRFRGVSFSPSRIEDDNGISDSRTACENVFFGARSSLENVRVGT